MEKLKEFAVKLVGLESGDDISKDLINEAKELGIVVCYGYSDDNAEFDGAWRDEVGCYAGGEIPITSKGLLEFCDNYDCPYHAKALESAKKINACWCDADSEYTWSYKTDIPHETFEMLEDGRKYCQGIVFYAKDCS